MLVYIHIYISSERAVDLGGLGVLERPPDLPPLCRTASAASERKEPASNQAVSNMYISTCVVCVCVCVCVCVYLCVALRQLEYVDTETLVSKVSSNNLGKFHSHSKGKFHSHHVWLYSTR
jgi:hypothetical protein